jgi:hypothetical protein
MKKSTGKWTLEQISKRPAVVVTRDDTRRIAQFTPSKIKTKVKIRSEKVKPKKEEPKEEETTTEESATEVKEGPYGGKKLDVMCERFAQALDTGVPGLLPTARDSVIASEISQAMLDSASGDVSPCVGTPEEMAEILAHREQGRQATLQTAAEDGDHTQNESIPLDIETLFDKARRVKKL